MAERILVVDDEDIIRESLSYVLKKEGYYVEEAPNGKEAYKKLLDEGVITQKEFDDIKKKLLFQEN